MHSQSSLTVGSALKPAAVPSGGGPTPRSPPAETAPTPSSLHAFILFRFVFSVARPFSPNTVREHGARNQRVVLLRFVALLWDPPKFETTPPSSPKSRPASFSTFSRCSFLLSCASRCLFLCPPAPFPCFPFFPYVSLVSFLCFSYASPMPSYAFLCFSYAFTGPLGKGPPLGKA